MARFVVHVAINQPADRSRPRLDKQAGTAVREYTADFCKRPAGFGEMVKYIDSHNVCESTGRKRQGMRIALHVHAVLRANIGIDEPGTAAAVQAGPTADLERTSRCKPRFDPPMDFCFVPAGKPRFRRPSRSTALDPVIDARQLSRRPQSTCDSEVGRQWRPFLQLFAARV